MKIVACMPSSRAAHATAWPWLPALAATTPAARSSGDSVASVLTAPRILNEPVRWRFSALSTSSRPISRESDADVYTGVTRAWPPIRSRAASMSVSVGAVLVAKMEDLAKDRTHSGERVELPLLNLVEQTGELGIPGHGRLEMAAGAGRGDREDLGGEVAATPFLETGCGGMGLDRCPKLVDPRRRSMPQ